MSPICLKFCEKDLLTSRKGRMQHKCDFILYASPKFSSQSDAFIKSAAISQEINNANMTMEGDTSVPNDFLEDVDDVDFCETESLDRSTFSDYSSLSNFSKEKQKYDTFDGEIGYRKGDSIVLLTNYSVQRTGYVTKDINSTTADGFLVDVIPKNSVRVQENREDDENSQRYRSYCFVYFMQLHFPCSQFFMYVSSITIKQSYVLMARFKRQILHVSN